jgi:hypothetical protein
MRPGARWSAVPYCRVVEQYYFVTIWDFAASLQTGVSRRHPGDDGLHGTRFDLIATAQGSARQDTGTYSQNGSRRRSFAQAPAILGRALIPRVAVKPITRPAA